MTTPAFPPYRPAPYIVASSGLTEEQLMAQFECFTDSLPYSSVAPGLVFERILGNLCTAVSRLQGSPNEQPLSSPGAKKSNENITTATGGVAVDNGLQPALTPNDAVDRFLELHAAVLKFKAITRYDQNPYRNWIGVEIVCQNGYSNPTNSGCTWPDSTFWVVGGIATGSYCTTEESRGIALLDEIERKITFPVPFTNAPQVLVWFTELDMRYGKTWKVCTSVANSSTTGFTLCIHTSGNGILYSAEVMWMAHENPNLIQTQFTVPVHPLCHLTGTQPDHNIQTTTPKLKQVLVVNEIVICGEVQWPVFLNPRFPCKSNGTVNWEMGALGNLSGFCTLGVGFILNA